MILIIVPCCYIILLGLERRTIRQRNDANMHIITLSYEALAKRARKWTDC